MCTHTQSSLVVMIWGDNYKRWGDDRIVKIVKFTHLLRKHAVIPTAYGLADSLNTNAYFLNDA